MKTLFSTLLIMASIAGPAAAQDIRVSLEGKSPATIREDIGRAASAVCTSAFRQGDVGVHELNACQRAVTDDAMQQARFLYKPA
jgi:hypothetical protein